MAVATAPEATPPVIEPPAALPLFSAEQLTEHARLLAVEHQAVILPGPNRLLPRLDENERLLREYNRATYAADQARQITPASEWILDNFYLIEEQVQMARRHLPRRYSRELPRLTVGRSAGLPRVYDITLGFISHVDAQLEMESLEAFVSAYQVVTPLKLGELWAVPIMIRLALIENLRRITERLTLSRKDRDLADEWALRLETTSEHKPSQVVVVVADMARANLPVTSSFVSEFHQKLSRSSTSVPLARQSGPGREPEPGCGPGFGEPHHHGAQDAERLGLALIRGVPEHRREDPEDRPRRRLPADGFCNQGLLQAHGGDALAAWTPFRGRHGGEGDTPRG
jgi:cyclic beta-1,2-glucan synthetase